MHGGFRYLQSLDFGRALTSMQDQERLLSEHAPLVRPLTCLMPLAPTGLRSRGPVQVGAALFGALQRWQGSSLVEPRVLSQAESVGICPPLIDLAPDGALLWQDAELLNPQDLAREIVGVISNGGGEIREGVAVTRVAIGSHAEVQLRTATGEQQVQAACVINAAGSAILDIPVHGTAVRRHRVPAWARAFNLVFPNTHKLEVAVGLRSHDRLFFFVPRAPDSLAVGTAYLPMDANTSPATVTGSEIRSFLAAASTVWPALGLAFDELQGVEVGVLPAWQADPQRIRLMAHPRLLASPGYVEVLSTKYTTFDSQAKAAVAAAAAVQLRCSTGSSG